jgi:hypothetical protein
MITDTLNHEEITDAGDRRDGIFRIIFWPKSQSLEEAKSADSLTEVFIDDDGFVVSAGPATHLCVDRDAVVRFITQQFPDVDIDNDFL